MTFPPARPRAFAPVWTERLLRVLLQKGIHTGVRLTGRRVTPDLGWAVGPVGSERIGAGIYDQYAAREGLTIERAADAGLLPDLFTMDTAGFSAAEVHPAIRDFYEHTSRWTMDVEVQWRGPLRFFAQTLLYLVSREIEQVNVPLSQREVNAGISSEILPLVGPDGRRPYTGWLRRFADTGNVIYAGFYTTAHVPGTHSACVKVSFPMPSGCTTVILRPENRPEGGMLLRSAGRGFGDPGTYRLHEYGRGGARQQVAYIPMHEHIELWPDGDGVRCDHRFSMWRFSFLLLRYRIRRT